MPVEDRGNAGLVSSGKAAILIHRTAVIGPGESEVTSFWEAACDASVQRNSASAVGATAVRRREMRDICLVRYILNQSDGQKAATSRLCGCLIKSGKTC